MPPNGQSPMPAGYDNINALQAIAQAIQALRANTIPVTWRQGGTTGNATWQTPGSSSTDLSQKAVVVQVGVAQLANTAGTDITITYPQPFAYPPIVIAMIQTANGVNEYTGINSVGATTFKARCTTTGGSGENVGWMAIGQLI